jgi:hypothetical protein
MVNADAVTDVILVSNESRILPAVPMGYKVIRYKDARRPSAGYTPPWSVSTTASTGQHADKHPDYAQNVLLLPLSVCRWLDPTPSMRDALLRESCRDALRRRHLLDGSSPRLKPCLPPLVCLDLLGLWI